MEAFHNVNCQKFEPADLEEVTEFLVREVLPSVHLILASPGLYVLPERMQGTESSYQEYPVPRRRDANS